MRQAAAEGYEVSYGLLNVAILITFVLAYLLLHGVLKRPPPESRQDRNRHEATRVAIELPWLLRYRSFSFCTQGLPTTQVLIAGQLGGHAGVAAHDACNVLNDFRRQLPLQDS